jgi:hypothetical protein
MMGIKKTMAKHFAWNAMLKRLHPAAVDVPLQLSTIIFPLSIVNGIQPVLCAQTAMSHLLMGTSLYMRTNLIVKHTTTH